MRGPVIDSRIFYPRKEKDDGQVMRQILCYGDSNTWGLIPGTIDRYEWNIRWTGLLQEKLKEHGFRVIEEGLCGRTTVFQDALRAGRRGSDLLPVLLESHRPVEAVILMLGTNDCKTVYRASAEVIGMGIGYLLNQIRRTAPEAKILLVSPIHLGDRVWEEGFDPEFDKDSVEVSRKLKAVYQKIAGKYGVEFLAASDCAVPSPVDREHLDEEGHRCFADALYQKLIDTVID